MQGGWDIFSFMLTQATMVFLYPKTSQMVHYFISWLRITRYWKLITLFCLLALELGVWIISGNSISIQILNHLHLCSKVSPFFLEESRLWSGAFISRPFRLGVYKNLDNQTILLNWIALHHKITEPLEWLMNWTI